MTGEKAPPKKLTKGEATRARILKAGQQVFAAHPFAAASLRMIGQKGGFDFTLIRHYFPSKADLFSEACTDLYENIASDYAAMYRGLEKVPLLESLSVFFDRVITQGFEKPEAFSLLMQNVAGKRKPGAAAGLDILPGFYRDSRAAIKKLLPLDPDIPEVAAWQYMLVLLIQNFLGAPLNTSRVLGMETGGRDHCQWIKEALLFLFYPSLKDLLKRGRNAF